jgi:PAS domain S-box-containing protein
LRAENSERNGRQRFETTLASIGDAVIVTDAAGRVAFTNKIALSLMRRTESEIAGKPLDEAFRIINEFTRVTVESPVTRVLREGGIVGLANHTVLIASDGTEVPIDDSAAPIRAADGSVQGTVLVFRDVTARRRAEATSRLLASVVGFSDDAIMSADLNGIVTSWN